MLFNWFKKKKELIRINDILDHFEKTVIDITDDLFWSDTDDIDWNKVKTVKDIKAILMASRVDLYQNRLEDIKEYLKDENI